VETGNELEADGDKNMEWHSVENIPHSPQCHQLLAAMDAPVRKNSELQLNATIWNNPIAFQHDLGRRIDSSSRQLFVQLKRRSSSINDGTLGNSVYGFKTCAFRTVS
jgi:hypothetical protein